MLSTSVFGAMQWHIPILKHVLSYGTAEHVFQARGSAHGMESMC